MFRLISLNFDSQILGNLKKGDLVFVPVNERGKTEYPYTTVLIGPNGSGKSTILFYLAEIFQDIEFYKRHNFRNKQSKINFNYTVEFEIDKHNYKITQRRTSQKKVDEKYINVLGWNYGLCIDQKEIDNHSGNWDSVQLPSSVIALSYLPMDRFSKKPNTPGDYYLYLGLVDRTNAARPRHIINNAAPVLFDTIINRKSTGFLKEILHFMQVDPDFLGVKNVYRYKKFFFTGSLTIKQFDDLFYYWERFSKRKDKPFGVDYFEKNISGNNELMSKLVQYMNIRAEQDKISIGKKSFLEFNLFENKELIEEWSLLVHLKRLDLIESFSLIFRKSRSSYIDDIKLSSGEFHYFSTVIAILGSIQENSLILIDEPETSFHPNWQMKYINQLKSLLKSFYSSHFIVSTHSHFIVSDLEGESSEVIGLQGNAPNISAEPLERNTYGWSAEEVLFKVFNLRSTRNFYIETYIRELLHLISNKSNDFERISFLSKELNRMKLDKNDPLTQILKESDEYVRNI